MSDGSFSDYHVVMMFAFSFPFLSHCKQIFVNRSPIELVKVSERCCAQEKRLEKSSCLGFPMEVTSNILNEKVGKGKGWGTD
jgi:hypothetical protein